MSKISVHVGVVSWEGRHSAALHIASELVDHVDKLTVVYSNSEEKTESGKGDWIRVDNAKFFGPKFKVLVDRVSEDVFLLIQADAKSDNWIDVVHSCKQAFSASDNIGYWGPEICVTPYTPEIVMLSKGEGTQVDCVHLDAIVCAMRKDVYQQLRTYPFEKNNLGWGVGLTASAASMLNGLRVVMDRGIVVSHPPSRGYSGNEAKQQLDQMLLELPVENQAVIKLIRGYCHRSRSAVRAWSQPMGLRQSLKSLVSRVINSLLYP